MPNGFTEGRIVDVIFFFHGNLHTDDKKVCEPQLFKDEAELFQVPERVNIYSYNKLEEIDCLSCDEKCKEHMISRI